MNSYTCARKRSCKQRAPLEQQLTPFSPGAAARGRAHVSWDMDLDEPAQTLWSYIQDYPEINEIYARADVFPKVRHVLDA